MKLKRIMALVLCFAMVLSTMSFNVFAIESTVGTEAELKAALAEGGTIVLSNDITVAEQLVIPEGVEVTIDLNGKTITGELNGASTTNHIYVMANNGTLTITDSSEDGAIISRGVYNYGKLTLENGKIDACDCNGGYAVNNESGSVFIMNGGSVTADYEDGDAPVSGNYDATALDVPENCTATLNGGTISNAGNFTFAISVEGELIVPADSTVSVTGVHGTVAVMGGEANIAGGTFKLVGSPNVTDSLIYVPSGTANITGGSFDASETLSSSGRIIGAYDSGKVTVNGGTFTSNGWFDFADSSIENVTVNDAICVACDDTVKSYVAENATITLNGESYTAPDDGGSDGEEDTILINTAEDLIALRDNVNAGNDYYEGKNVKLNADIDLENTNWAPIGSASAEHGFMGNFDGNGHTIYNLTIEDPALDADGYAYAGLFGVTEGTDKDNQNIIKNLTVENVTISTTGHIVAAAIAYPYYTIVENVKVCGNIDITGGDYTAGVLAYTRRCVDASDLFVEGAAGSTIGGGQVVGGIISDIQMNGGLIANYSNFNASGVTISGTKNVGGISGIIASQTLDICSVKDVTLDCDDARVGTVAGCLGGVSTISDATVENVSGAAALVGGTYNDGKSVEAKIGDTYYATLAKAFETAENGDTVTLLCDVNAVEIPEGVTLETNGYRFGDSLTGMGTKENPYLINNIDDLVWFRNDVNAGNTYEGKYVKLTADIDLEGYEEMNVNHEGNNVSASTFRPIGDYSCNKASFKGIFDGGNNTISNLYISGWDINYHWDNYGPAGLFGTVENATIKNLTVEGFEIQVEGGDVAAIAGHAKGNCTFENITVTDSKIATYNNGCAGIVAWSEAGNYTFKGIEVTDSVVLAGLWGSFDSSIGGVLAQADAGATYLFEDIDVACRLDIYNDVTAAYKYHLYRMCGMLIGRGAKFMDGNEVDLNASNITCKNVNITIGEWANYTYINTSGNTWKRVEPGYTYGGVDISQYPDATIDQKPMTSIVGGGQYGYSGTTAEEFAAQGFDETEIKVVDFAKIVRSNVAKIGEVGYATLAEAFMAATDGDTITLVRDIELDKMVTVPQGANITLNLDGKTISGTHGTDYSMIHVLNGAELTVKDTNTEKNGKITYAAGGNNIGAAVWVEGKLTLESGTIEVTGSWTLGFAVDLRPNAWGTAHTVDASFVMNGGTVKSTDTAVRVASNSSDAYPELGVTFTMNAGSIESTWDAIFVQHLYVGDLNINVANGTVSGTNSAMRIYGDAGSDIDMIVTGGTFEGDIKVADAYVNTDAIAISGGTFDKDPSAYCDDEHTSAIMPDGKYTVVKAAEGKTAYVLRAPNHDNTEEVDYIIELPAEDITGKNISVTMSKPDSSTAEEFQGFPASVVLSVEVKDDAGNDIYTENETEKDIIVTIPYKAGLEKQNIIVLHDGEPVSFDCYEYDTTTGIITVKVAHFSEIAVYEVNYTAEIEFDTEVLYNVGDVVNVTVRVPGNYVGINSVLEFNGEYFDLLNRFGETIVLTENKQEDNKYDISGNYEKTYAFKLKKLPETEDTTIDFKLSGEIAVSVNHAIDDVPYLLTPVTKSVKVCKSAFDVEVVDDYITGYYLVKVYGYYENNSELTYKYDDDGYMYEIIHSTATETNKDNYTKDGVNARVWVVKAEYDANLEPVEFNKDIAKEKITVIKDTHTTIDVGYDVNGVNSSKGDINILDVVAAYSAAFKSEEVDVNIMVAADIDGSMKIDAGDFAAIIRNYNK